MHTAALPPRPDPVRREAFAARLREIQNAAAAALAISLGHRLGLFDVLATLPPCTSAELARVSRLHERYVREWLAALTLAGVLSWDPEQDTWALPPEHASLLTRRSAPDNLAVSFQLVPMVAAVETELADRFRWGGGIEYERYERFHEIMAEVSSQTVVSALFEHVLPLVPGLGRRLQAGIDVLDIGCGHGRAMVALASAYPNSRFLGIDLAPEAIASARGRAAELGLRNLRFEVMDAARMPEDLRADLVTAFDAIHDQAEPDRVLAHVRRLLPDDGVFLMQEMAASSRLEENLDHPLGTFLYMISLGHCTPVSLARGGAGLGACWGRERIAEALERAGFAPVEWHRLAHDPLDEYYVARPARAMSPNEATSAAAATA